MTVLEELEKHTAELQRRLRAGESIEDLDQGLEVGTYTPPGRPRILQDSVNLNLRLDREKRQKFIQFCKEEGKTVSEVIRQYIDECLNDAA